jgi:hypothetical protein
MDERRSGNARLKPRYALEVAVVGNRRFAGEPDEAPNEAAARMKAQAVSACTAVWQALIGAMQSALDEDVEAAGRMHRLRDFFGAETPRLGVLSGLAAGADQIGVETALQAGQARGDVVIELEAVLPFPEDDYPGAPGKPRPEFRLDEADTLTRLAAQARQVVRLDGEYGDGGERGRAYQHARDVLLQNADLLVAIYDPRSAGGPAGTLETVDVALTAGLPVVAVLVAEDEARVAVYTSPADRTPDAGEWDRARRLDDAGWRAGLAERIGYLVSLPHQRPVAGEGPHERAKRLEALAETVGRLRLMYGEARPHAMCRHPIPHRVFAGAWQTVLRLGAACSRPHDLREHGTPPHAARDALTVQPYAAYYARASELSDAYMRTYRGAFVLSFALAGVAVAAAVSLMAIAVWTHGAPPLLAVLALGGLKVGIILALVILERSSHHARSQEHAADFRYLAELLRPMQWLSRVATAVPSVELPAHAGPLDPRRGWTPWLFRAIARGTPSVALPSAAGGESFPREVTLDAAAARAVLDEARSDWLQGQRRYHWNNVLSMHGVENGLERLAKILLWIVLVCAGVAVLLEALPHLLPTPWADRVADLHRVAIVLGAASAALPAFIAALGGIMFQSEAKRLRLRSEAMHRGLLEQQRSLDAQIAAISRAAGGHAWSSAQRLRAVAALTIQEAGDWKVLYQTHEVHAG